MRVLSVVLCLLVACGGSSTDHDCQPGETRSCYAGPDGTEGVGICAAGIESCGDTGTWSGYCLGDLTPFVEQCDGVDEDCNGVIDDVEGSGPGCTGADGCEGAMHCDGDHLACIAPKRNECGICGGPVVADVGEPCNAGSCPGTLACNAAGDGVACTAAPANACGVCGGPVVTGLGDPCTSADNCDGSVICNAAGDGTLCDAPARNECAVCGGPPVSIGASCQDGHGCPGVTACNATGDAARCEPDAPCAHIVISEVSTRSKVCSTDELIELYNPSSRELSLAGYTLRSQASSGGFTRLVTFPAGAVMPAHSFVLIASTRASGGCNPGGYTGVPANTVAPDFTYAAIDVGATAGQLWLTSSDADPASPSDPNVVDLIGYGSVTSFEGAPAAAPASGGSLERKANAGATATSMAAGGADHAAGNAQDTDDNSADLVLQAAREPQNAASAPEP